MKLTRIILPKFNYQYIWFGWLCLAMFGFGVLVVTKLIDLQMFKGEKYLALAEQNRWFSQSVPAERGIILDRYGEPLTLNRKRYFTPIDPEAVWSPQVPINRDQALNLMVENQATKSTDTKTEKLTLSRVNFGMERIYPLAGVLSHVIGYVGPVTADDLLKKPGLNLTELVGKTGLEARLQDQLRGGPGLNKYEVNALGKKQRLVAEQAALPGAVISTTLDPYLSNVAAQAMGEKTGAVVVFDAETGEILSLTSQPNFEPSLFQPANLLASNSAEQVRRSVIANYFQDPKLVMFNRATAGTYPPGSIFKLVTALAGLAEDKITPETIVEDTGVLKVGEYGYANWYFTQYGRTDGPIALERALARSNDIYFYKAAEAIGPTLLADWARRFGFGRVNGVELGGEASGLVPDPTWKEKQTGERWFLGNTYHFGIGQGDLLVTPIQIAQMVQAVSNQGKNCQLHLLESTTKECGDLGIQPEQLKPVLSGMFQACSPGGTAFPFFEHNQRVLEQAGLTIAASPQEKLIAGAVACKTGTAEIGAANAKGQRPTHGWFIMTARVDQLMKTNLIQTTQATASADLISTWHDHDTWLKQVKQVGFPRQIGIVVLVESQPEKVFMEGSGDAAPVAKQIFDWIVRP